MTDEEVAKMLAEVAEEAEREDEEEAKGLKQFTYVRPKPPKDPSQVYSIRIPVSRLAELQLLAGRRAQQPTALMREFVLDRLDAEHEAPVLTLRLAPPVYEQVTAAAESAGLSIDEFVTQAVVLLAGKCGPVTGAEKPAKRRRRT